MGTTEELFGNEYATEEVKPAVAEEIKTEETETEAPEPIQTESEVVEPQVEEGKRLYTPEQMRSLDFEDIDTTRIPPEMLPFYKAMQASFTKKNMSVSERIKKLEESKSAPKQPQTVQEYFEQNPEWTLAEIDKIILQKMEESDRLEDEGDDKAAKRAMKEAIQWTATKTSLTTNRMFQTEKEFKKAREKDKMLSSFPDFDTRKEIAMSTMQESTGLSMEQISDMLDVDKNGAKALELIKHFHSVHEKAQAKNTSQTKLKKETPSQLGRAGSTQSATPSNPKDDYNELFEKWKANPSDRVLFRKVLEAKGQL